jgi:hypothetical protein
MKGAAQRWFVASMLVTVLVIPAGNASAADVTDADRTFRNYTRETATVSEGQVRVEVRGLQEQDENRTIYDLLGLRLRSVFPGRKPTALSGGIIDLVGSYGVAKNMEVGFIVPGYIESLKFSDGTRINNQDVGDLQLYGKFQRSVAEHCAVGAGVELTMPNGPKDKGFSRGELGAAPVVSTRYQRGPWAVGANVGYEMYTGNPSDVFDYGVEIILRGSETYALRTELAGRTFTEAGKRFHDLTILPGIDFNLSNNVTIRPTGMVGGNDAALDWGIGLGIAMTF